MDCRRVSELLDDYFEGALTADLARQVERHIAGCASCAREAELARAVNEALSAEPGLEAPRAAGERVVAEIPRIAARARWMRFLRAANFAAAAAAAVMVAVGVAVWLFLPAQQVDASGGESALSGAARAAKSHAAETYSRWSDAADGILGEVASALSGLGVWLTVGIALLAAVLLAFYLEEELFHRRLEERFAPILDRQAPRGGTFQP